MLSIMLCVCVDGGHLRVSVVPDDALRINCALRGKKRKRCKTYKTRVQQTRVSVLDLDVPNLEDLDVPKNLLE